MKAGIAVATGTTEEPNELFSSMYTPGVAKFEAISFFYLLVLYFLILLFIYKIFSLNSVYSGLLILLIIVDLFCLLTNLYGYSFTGISSKYF
jgi:hypothetical protein